MKVYEFKLKVYALENMNSKRSLEYISQLIDKSFLKNKELSDFHEENVFKNYVHNSFYPVEKSKIYQKGNIYTVIIRTVDERLADCICQPKIRSKDHLILGHFLVNKCASKICVQRHKYFKLLKI